jgi:nicotinamidase-related amidase
MKRPVLIVIDMLRDFLDGWPADSRERLVQSIRRLASFMREHAHPLIWVRQEFEPDLRDAFPEMRANRIAVTIRGTPGCQIVPELPVAASDIVIVKKRYSAFFGTDLDGILANLKPDTIILAGINTHACIRMTAIDAYQRDWPVVVASECVGSYDEEHQAITLQYLRGKIAKMMGNDEIRAVLCPVQHHEDGQPNCGSR